MLVCLFDLLLTFFPFFFILGTINFGSEGASAS